MCVRDSYMMSHGLRDYHEGREQERPYDCLNLTNAKVTAVIRG